MNKIHILYVYLIGNTYGRTPLTVRFVLYIVPNSFVLLVDFNFVHAPSFLSVQTSQVSKMFQLLCNI
jgi:hypothetical protein